MKSFMGRWSLAGSCLVMLLAPRMGAGKDGATPKEVDICVYGGTSAGVIAAYTASIYGKSVLLIEPKRNLGGMSSGGLGYTDIGNKYVVTGLALDFYRRIGRHYNVFEKWIFEPGVAEGIFKDYVKRGKVPVRYGMRLNDVKKTGRSIEEVVLENTYSSTAPLESVKAKMFIDCSYEGDLMAKSGVSYHVGREDNSVYDETINGVQWMKNHQFPDGIDPYVEKGNPASGLLWGISKGDMKTTGSGDHKVQAYCFRIALTNNPDNRIEISQPDNYDPKRYELLIRLKEVAPWKGLKDAFIWSLMPNGKTDINNRNAFSTDMIAANWEYPDADYKRREEIWKEHEDYTKGLLYFVGNDARIPEFIRNEMKQWGYPKDEYTDNGNWSHQLYIREARRMVGALVMNQNHCQGRDVVTDGIGWAAYTMDSHNTDRHVVNGMVKNEGNVEVGGFDPFPISYRAIVPKRDEVSNLLVPVCMSASHIAYGSIRMEPVFMVLAQSAAVAAVSALNHGVAVQDVNVSNLQSELKRNPLADGSVPDILVDNDDRENVVVSGKWSRIKRGGFGLNYLATRHTSGTATVTYKIPVERGGEYDVYAYLGKNAEKSKVVRYVVFDGQNEHRVEKNIEGLKVVGQTSGEWLHVGRFDFKGKNGAFVKIGNEGADGVVMADAVQLVAVREPEATGR